MLLRLLDPVLFFLSGFVPRVSSKVVFGAWMGKRYADNPKYLLEFLARYGSTLDLVWIGEINLRPMLPPNLPVRFVRRGSLRSVWEMLTAGSCFVTHDMNDLGSFNLMRGALRVHLGHGLAIKRMGSHDRVLRSQGLNAVRRVLRNTYRFDHYVACSPAHREKLLAENSTANITPTQLLDCGQPRVDFLLAQRQTPAADRIRARLLATHGLSPATRIISYLPTFRDQGQPVFSFARVDPSSRARLDTLLHRLDASIFEKTHFAEKAGDAALGHQPDARVFSLSGTGIDSQDLLLVTDLLITDYSGCYVDFLVLDRPVLHFAYDRSYYENSDRGLYFNLDEIAGGAVVADFEPLCARIETILSGHDPDRNQREKARVQLTSFERGTASAQIASLLPVRRFSGAVHATAKPTTIFPADERECPR